MAYMRNNLVGDGAVVLQNVVVLCTDGLCDLFGDGLFFLKIRWAHGWVRAKSVRKRDFLFREYENDRA